MISSHNDTNRYVPYSEDRIRNYQHKGLWQNLTHFDFLSECKDKFGHTPAVIDGEKELSYQQLYKLAIDYGSTLKKQGLKQDDFVIIQSANSIEFFVVLFAMYWVGIRPVFCLEGLKSYEIEQIAINSGAVGFLKVVQPGDTGSAVSLAQSFLKPNLTLWFRETIVSKNTLSESFSIEADTEPLEPNSSVSTDIAFLQLSGGTTGLPKLIARTHADYLYSVRKSVEICRNSPSDKVLMVLPVMHNFAMSSPGFLGVLASGGCVVLTRDSSPRTCFKLIESHGITHAALVPALANVWINTPLLGNYDLSSLSVIQVGGAKLLPQIATSIQTRLKTKLQQVYGMAEGLVNYTRYDDDEETIIHTQGRPMCELDEVKIVGEDGLELPQGQVGKIYTRGPYTINGYYNNSDANLNSFSTDGFYITGDLGFLDEAGNITVTGRSKEMINRAGEKITPSEIESLLIQHKNIKDVSIVGIPDEILGEKIRAVVKVVDPKIPISLKDTRKFLLDMNVADYKLPDEIEQVEQFELTNVGKVNKNKLAIDKAVESE